MHNPLIKKEAEVISNEVKNVEVYKVQRLVDYCCTFLVKEHGLEVLLAQYRLPLEILEHLRVVQKLFCE